MCKIIVHKYVEILMKVKKKCKWGKPKLEGKIVEKESWVKGSYG